MNIPTPDDILAEAAPILPVIQAALRHGIKKARAYFEGEQTEPDPVLAPNVIRWQAKRYFDHAGHAVHDLEEDYERPAAGNNGLRLSFKRLRFIIRKAAEGELPVPSSETQKKFYSYNLIFQFGNLPEDKEIHVVVLWDTDASYAELTSLDLVLPRTGGQTREQTKACWYASILDLTETSDHDDIDIQQREDDKDLPGGA